MKKRLLIALISILLISCNDNSKEIKRIYSNRIDILQNFENLSVYRRGKGVFIDFYKDSLITSYLYEKKTTKLLNKELVFVNGEFQFPTKTLNKTYLMTRNGVNEYLRYYLSKMKEYKIKSVDSQFKKFGITLELNLKDCQVFYVSDLKSIKNSQWIEFVKTSHKIDEYWYWREYDKIE